MRKLVLAVAAVSTLVFAPSANAASLIETYAPGDPEFTVSGNIFSGPISGDIGVSGIVAGLFSHTFAFTIPQTGVGSASITTSATFPGSTLDTDFTSVWFNGSAASLASLGGGLVEVAFSTGVPITAGTLNQLVINGVSRGNGSYGGQITFSPQGAIPEPSAWAMMLFGFGGVGFAMRRRKGGHGTKRLRVSYS